MSVRSDSNSYLTEEQQQVYQLRESLERNGGSPVGFLGLLAAVVKADTWRKVPSGVNGEKPFADFTDFLQAKPPFGLGTKVEHVRVLLQIPHPHEGVPHIRQEMDEMRAVVNKLLGPDLSADPVFQDAQRFGTYATSGGWLFGLMVARSVHKNRGQRPGTVVAQAGELAGPSQKIPLTAFAAAARCSTARVSRFYNAWKRAATAGLVPACDELRPGDTVELPDTSLWSTYFTSFERSTDRREAIAEQAEASGTSYSKALDIATNPSALRTAILADPKAATAAHEALMDRLEDDSELQRSMARALAEAPQLKKALATEARRTDQLDYVRKIAEEGTVKTLAGRCIEAPAQVKAEAERYLTQLENTALDGPAESVAQAYEAVQQLITETIEANPEISLQERRARFHSQVTKASKTFQQLALDDVADLYEADVVSELEALQTAVTTCLEGIKRGALKQ
ncbi:hypothetical protein [Streptomyces rimosus]|uniref:hypothetical protein n=1 Tax=Streptomyces rimosus TaxID=1927 RepID=UPI00068CC1B7|nr:hypothetical protein [Streptomyces rimosus]